MKRKRLKNCKEVANAVAKAIGQYDSKANPDVWPSSNSNVWSVFFTKEETPMSICISKEPSSNYLMTVGTFKKGEEVHFDSSVIVKYFNRPISVLPYKNNIRSMVDGLLTDLEYGYPYADGKSCTVVPSSYLLHLSLLLGNKGVRTKFEYSNEKPQLIVVDYPEENIIVKIDDDDEKSIAPYGLYFAGNRAIQTIKPSEVVDKIMSKLDCADNKTDETITRMRRLYNILVLNRVIIPRYEDVSLRPTCDGNYPEIIECTNNDIPSISMDCLVNFKGEICNGSIVANNSEIVLYVDDDCHDFCFPADAPLSCIANTIVYDAIIEPFDMYRQTYSVE